MMIATESSPTPALANELRVLTKKSNLHKDCQALRKKYLIWKKDAVYKKMHAIKQNNNNKEHDDIYCTGSI